jgi:hypothetical protein
VQLRLTHACQFSRWRWTSLVHHLRVQHRNNAMNINDEGRSNAAYWHERAMKAEARLAEEESAHRVTAGIFASTLVRADAAEARLAEAEQMLALTRRVHAQSVQVLIDNGWALDNIRGWHRPTDSASGGEG